ncbi:MAG: hypothetical protein PWQ84_1473, partial [Thermotogaceae bacterium]|nr:hypothetical protein [Thermotogaceae bacterium]
VSDLTTPNQKIQSDLSNYVFRQASAKGEKSLKRK